MGLATSQGEKAWRLLGDRHLKLKQQLTWPVFKANAICVSPLSGIVESILRGNSLYLAFVEAHLGNCDQVWPLHLQETVTQGTAEVTKAGYCLFVLWSRTDLCGTWQLLLARRLAFGGRIAFIHSNSWGKNWKQWLTVTGRLISTQQMKEFLTIKTTFPQIISPQTTRPLDVISVHHGGKFRNLWVRQNKEASSRQDSSNALMYSS